MTLTVCSGERVDPMETHKRFIPSTEFSGFRFQLS